MRQPPDFNLKINLLQRIWQGFPGGASSKEHACLHAGDIRDMFNPWVEKILWSRKRQPTPVFLPGESHGQRSLAGYSPQGHKESDMIEAS